MYPAFDRRLGLTAALLLAASPATVVAQACVAVPTDTPDVGSPSNAPFGNNNPSDPIFSDLRYQVLVDGSLFGGQPARIRDLQVAPSGSRLRQFTELTVTMGHNPAGQLVPAMQNNVAAPLATSSTQQWLLPTQANTWSSVGLPVDFLFDPALGDLVVEFRVRGAGATDGAGPSGLRTSQSLPYCWTTGGGFSGTVFAGGGIKLRLCTDTHGLLELGGGCAGSNQLSPMLTFAGSAQVGGPGVSVQLSDAPDTAPVAAVLVLSLGLRDVPVDLGLIGAGGCSAHVFGDVAWAAFPTAGAAALPLAVPAAPFGCVPVYAQWFVLDQAANALGITSSNPGRVLVGN